MTTVIVTGAGQGIGAATARLLADSGVRVIGVDRSDEPAEDLSGTEYVPLDVTDAVAWAAFAERLHGRGERVDGLVANAGVTWRARLMHVEPADLHSVYDVNVVGVLLAIQTAVPLMTAGGAIVVVGSAAALTGHYPIAYTASKWALRGVVKAACLELGPRNIRVNAIHPGYIETRMTASAPSTFLAANLAETPLGRAGTADEPAALIAFLLSAAASFISGAEIPVDGGLTAHGGVKSVSDAMRSHDLTIVTRPDTA